MQILQHMHYALLRRKYHSRQSLTSNPNTPWAIYTYDIESYARDPHAMADIMRTDNVKHNQYHHIPRHHIIGQCTDMRTAFARAQRIQQAYMQKYGLYDHIPKQSIGRPISYNTPYSTIANHLWIRNTDIPIDDTNIQHIIPVHGRYRVYPNIHTISNDRLIISSITLSSSNTYDIEYQHYIPALDIYITYRVQYHPTKHSHIFHRKTYIHYTIQSICDRTVYHAASRLTSEIPYIHDVIQQRILAIPHISQHQKSEQLRILYNARITRITDIIPDIYTIPAPLPHIPKIPPEYGEMNKTLSLNSLFEKILKKN